MDKNKNEPRNEPEKNMAKPEKANNKRGHINPFRDNKNVNNEQQESPQEEAELEQQRKETLTERD
jgi:hypothetical protein